MRIKALVICMGVLFAQLAFARTTIEDLDATVEKALSLQYFLQDSALREEYYLKLSDYYGGRLPREAYEAILVQLAEVAKDVPEIGARLWEKSDLKSGFELRLDFNSSGLELKSTEWAKEISDLQTKLKTVARPYMTTDASARPVAAALATLEAALADFDRELEALPRKERNRVAAKRMLEAPFQSESTQELLAWIAYQRLFLPQHKEILNGKDADLILFLWDAIRSSSGPIDMNGIVVPERIVRMAIKQYLPPLEKPALELADGKPKETKLFRVATRPGRNGPVPVGQVKASNIKFTRLPRAFHGLWKGVPLKECVGGACDSLDALTPRRWISAAIRGARFFHVERDGSYLGFLHTTPLQIQGKLYENIEFGAPVLLSSMVEKRQAAGSYGRKRLYELLLDHLSDFRVQGSNGYVVGRSKAINNAQVLGAVHTSVRYRLAPTIGTASLSDIDDKLMEQVVVVADHVEVRSRGEAAKKFSGKYSKTLVIDALVKNADELKLIAPYHYSSDPRGALLRLADERIESEIRLRDLEFVWEEVSKSLDGGDIADVIKENDPEDIVLTELIRRSRTASGNMRMILAEIMVADYRHKEDALLRLLEMTLEPEGIAPQTFDSAFLLLNWSDGMPEPHAKVLKIHSEILRVVHMLPTSSRHFWFTTFFNGRAPLKAKEYLATQILRTWSGDERLINLLPRVVKAIQVPHYLTEADLLKLLKIKEERAENFFSEFKDLKGLDALLQKVRSTRKPSAPIRRCEDLFK